MGNYLESKGYTVHIHLDRPDKVYFEGESVSGKVQFSNTSQQEQRLCGIYLALRCKVIYVSSALHNSKKMLSHRDNCFKQEYRSTLYEKKLILCEEYMLPCGETTIPFSFIINGQLPPTVTHRGSVEVRYDLQLSVGLPHRLHTTNIRVASTVITFLPKVDPMVYNEGSFDCQILSQDLSGLSKQRRSSSFVGNWDLKNSNDMDNCVCELTVPDISVGVQQMIPYTVKLKWFETKSSSTANWLLKVKLIQCLTVFSNLYRKTMITHVMDVPAGNKLMTAPCGSNKCSLYEHSAKFCLPKCTIAPSYFNSTRDRYGISVSYIITCTLRYVTYSEKETKRKRGSTNDAPKSSDDTGFDSIGEEKSQRQIIMSECKLVACSPVIVHNAEAIKAHPEKL